MSSLPKIYLPSPSSFLRSTVVPSRLPQAATSPSYLRWMLGAGLVLAMAWTGHQAFHRQAVVDRQSRVLVTLSETLSDHQDAGALSMRLAQTQALADRTAWHKAFLARETATAAWRKALASRIASDYKLAPQAAQFLVKEGQMAAESQRVDPVLLMAVVGIESRFNPYVISSAGAIGLTQAMPSAHPKKIQEIKDKGSTLVDPSSNLHVGATILAECLHRSHGNTVNALQCYNGAGNDATAKYAHKVLRIYERFNNRLPALIKGPATPYPPETQLASTSVSFPHGT